MPDINRSCWELMASGTLSHDSTIIQCLPSDDVNYGPEYVFDLVPPAEVWTFNATPGLTRQQRDDLITAAKTRNAVVTLTDSTGQDYTGRITSASWEGQEGSEYYAASLTLRSCANEAANNPTVPIDWGRITD